MVMRFAHLKKIALIVGGLVLSLALLFVLERLGGMHTPGFLLANKMIAGGPGGMDLWFDLGFGVDFSLCVGVVWGLYLLALRLGREEKK
jgi:hypothetical protein